MGKPVLPVSGLFSGLVMTRPSTSSLATSRPSFSSHPPPSLHSLSPSHKKAKLSAGVSSSPSTPTAAQARKKPVLQSVDIAQLVREKGAAGMTKVNTATLLGYCRKEGIQGAKAKSKK